jgi:hypothetical protein
MGSGQVLSNLILYCVDLEVVNGRLRHVLGCYSCTHHKVASCYLLLLLCLANQPCLMRVIPVQYLPAKMIAITVLLFTTIGHASLVIFIPCL